MTDKVTCVDCGVELASRYQTWYRNAGKLYCPPCAFERRDRHDQALRIAAEGGEPPDPSQATARVTWKTVLLFQLLLLTLVLGSVLIMFSAPTHAELECFPPHAPIHSVFPVANLIFHLCAGSFVLLIPALFVTSFAPGGYVYFPLRQLLLFFLCFCLPSMLFVFVAEMSRYGVPSSIVEPLQVLTCLVALCCLVRNAQQGLLFPFAILGSILIPAFCLMAYPSDGPRERYCRELERTTLPATPAARAPDTSQPVSRIHADRLRVSGARFTPPTQPFSPPVIAGFTTAPTWAPKPRTRKTP